MTPVPSSEPAADPDPFDTPGGVGGAGAGEPPDPGVVARLRRAGCVFAEEEARLLIAAAPGSAELTALVERRATGEPLEHVIGRARFGGMWIVVDPGVFVPRRRTEFLLERAAALLRPGIVVVDLCCGSGALGAALLERERRIDLHAADLDPAAVRCARRNLVALGPDRVHRGDLFEALPADLSGRIEVLVANVPYVPTGDIALLPGEAREHEARAALDGGPDGLDVLRRVAAGAVRWLAPGGRLLAETGDRQADAAVAVLVGSGLVPDAVTSEDHGTTVIAGLRPAGP
ncbi:putative protein N(5)-glutamine methyltransferase [Streptomyces sp. ST2-7A]|uniref:putative protein N(5)-glutamine methyltransferase n=1 Tax=Streptomyces sp. ST2-7A TaxID=2907214 RepID=UPI001F2AD7B5|nr:putative protein N(5)-glutamine methyltransferase [Streptomyces sp. ST2-7A]MCE7081389.1 putative protein N(5)-glutamine methyltransferase [Streptomyces sp. ST2-7A]